MSDAKEVTKRLEQGTYVQGLYLKGARWNMEEECLLPKTKRTGDGDASYSDYPSGGQQA